MIKDSEHFDSVANNPQSQLVGYVAWDSGAAGVGADSESVYRLSDEYFYLSSAGEEFGPYSTLMTALQENELLKVTEATTKISFSELAEEDIASALVLNDLADRHPLVINGSRWVYHQPKKVFQKEEK